MSEELESEPVETTEDEEVNESTEDEEVEEQPDPDEGLKKALKSERQARRAAERKARELEAAQESAGKEPAEQALDQARREAAAEATQKANARILKSEIRAAAKGRLADPSDAFAYLDTEEFEVGDDGEVDLDAIEEAIGDLLTRKPYLAADSGEKFRGSADQGAQGKQSRPSQLTANDLKNMTPQEIVAAQEAGRLKKLMGAR